MSLPHKVRRFRWGGLVWVAGLLLARAAGAQPADSLAGVRVRIAALTAESRFASARWGIEVVSLDSGEIIFAQRANETFIPASNAKLFTAALALQRLGPDFRIRTSVEAVAPPDTNGTLHGDLILVGRGDPTLTGRSLAVLARAVRAAGVRRVTGDLLADVSCFRGPTTGAGWEAEDRIFAYAPEVSPLTLNANATVLSARPGAAEGKPGLVVVQLPVSFLVISNLTRTVAAGGAHGITFERETGGSVLRVAGRVALGGRAESEAIAVPQPARWCGERFREELRRQGVVVAGSVQVMDETSWAARPQTTALRIELAAVTSPPLGELLARMLKSSQNLYAQLLLLQVGAAEQAHAGGTNAPPVATVDAGLQALAAFLAEAGIPPATVRFEEGSGLSRRNTVTAAALVRLLQFMDRSPRAAVFRDGLPVAGVDGTLKQRMTGTPAEGNVRAKTGSFTGVQALSGYVATRAGERLAFALLLNGEPAASISRSTGAELDRVAVLLAGLNERTSREGSAGAAPTKP
ncbi:MAG: D-alanyl-D-alanine carboxypeptidase/D-alanyl-D-alanine-endopeptidase [Verrucomicrobiota bacterium]|jgi:D-alanyl-D-alanine carboxypeptidase/D-alanyl-D-alanine-endopeptidase (penicillin-binding protein 4)